MDLFDFRILGSSAKRLDYRLQLVTTTKVFFLFRTFHFEDTERRNK